MGYVNHRTERAVTKGDLPQLPDLRTTKPVPSPGHLEECINYQNNDWVEWPTNNFGDELFELAVREKKTRDTKVVEKFINWLFSLSGSESTNHDTLHGRR